MQVYRFASPIELTKGTATVPSAAFVTELGVTGFWLDEAGSIPAMVFQVGGL
jgi:hypothetical protein